MNCRTVCLFLITIFMAVAGRAQNCLLTADSLNSKAVALQQIDNEASLIVAKTAYNVALRAKDTLTMAESLINIGLAMYYTSRFDSALVPLKKSYHLYSLLNDSAGISAAANNIGLIYMQINEMLLAKKYFRISLQIDIVLEDSAGMAYGLNNLANVYYWQDNYNKALEFFILSANLDQKAGNRLGAAKSWQNIGVIYSEIGQLNIGNHYFLQALKIFTELGMSVDQSLVLTNLGDNFRLMHQQAKARELMRKAISISKKNKNTNELINAYIFYSKLLIDENSIDSADYYLFTAMNMCVETGNDLMACNALLQHGILLSDEKKYEEANQCLLNAYEFASNMGSSSVLKEISLLLSENYATLGKFDEALKYQKKVTEISSVKGITDNANVRKTTIVPLENEAISMNTLLYGALIGLLLIGILPSIYFYRRMKLYQRQLNSNSASGKERK